VAFLPGKNDLPPFLVVHGTTLAQLWEKRLFWSIAGKPSFLEKQSMGLGHSDQPAHTTLSPSQGVKAASTLGE
jgi:hypothetical protein